jgi:hypothetical protein
LNDSRGGKGANKVAGARSFYQDMGGRINRKSRRKDTPEEKWKNEKECTGAGNGDTRLKIEKDKKRKWRMTGHQSKMEA